MKIVLIEPLGVPEGLIRELSAGFVAAGHTFAAYDTRSDDPAELARRAGDADIVIEGNQPLPAAALAALARCRYLSVGFSGIDHLDAAAARAQGITVSNSAGYADTAVAELALGMMLALLRSLSAADAACRAGGTKAGLAARTLRGKTVGIVGMGACGCRTAELVRAFGARVIFTTPRPSARAAALGEARPLEALFAEADILSLHCPLTDETRGMVSAGLLARMKPTALLVNTARGPVVDAAALAAALRSGRIAGAAVDVYDTEPPLAPGHPLLAAPRCIATPHIGYYTEESMVLRARIAFGNVEAFLAGSPRNVKIQP